VHWSWGRVRMPLLGRVGYALRYLAVGFTWLAIVGGEGPKIRESKWADFYQPAALLCMVGFVDNLLRRTGPGESAWFWLASGRIEVIWFVWSSPPGIPVSVRVAGWGEIGLGGRRRGNRDRRSIIAYHATPDYDCRYQFCHRPGQRQSQL